jgi:hypothetical protein
MAPIKKPEYEALVRGFPFGEQRAIVQRKPCGLLRDIHVKRCTAEHRGSNQREQTENHGSSPPRKKRAGSSCRLARIDDFILQAAHG